MWVRLCHDTTLSEKSKVLVKQSGLDCQNAGGVAPNASPGGKLSPPQAVTEEECGGKSSSYFHISGIFQTFRFRRSSSDLASLGHLPPGGRVLVLIGTLSV